MDKKIPGIVEAQSSNLKDHLNEMAAFESQTRDHTHCTLYVNTKAHGQN